MRITRAFDGEGEPLQKRQNVEKYTDIFRFVVIIVVSYLLYIQYNIQTNQKLKITRTGESLHHSIIKMTRGQSELIDSFRPFISVLHNYYRKYFNQLFMEINE